MIVTTLTRLSLGTRRPGSVDQLLSDYRTLVTLYGRAASGQGQRASAHLIGVAQRATANSAIALRVPRCSPVPMFGY
jgi:hypothetical protein